MRETWKDSATKLTVSSVDLFIGAAVSEVLQSASSFRLKEQGKKKTKHKFNDVYMCIHTHGLCVYVCVFVCVCLCFIGKLSGYDMSVDDNRRAENHSGLTLN